MHSIGPTNLDLISFYMRNGIPVEMMFVMSNPLVFIVDEPVIGANQALDIPTLPSCLRVVCQSKESW